MIDIVRNYGTKLKTVQRAQHEIFLGHYLEYSNATYMLIYNLVQTKDQ